MTISYKHKIYTTLGTAEKVESDAVAVVTNSSGVPARNYSILGKSIVLNQELKSIMPEAVEASSPIRFNLLDTSGFTEKVNTIADGITAKLGQDKSIYLTGTATSAGGRNTWGLPVNLTANHKYYVAQVISDLDGPFLSMIGQTSKYFSGQFIACDLSGQYDFGYNVRAGVVYDTYIYPMVVDLTEMYGAGNEPTTASAIPSFYGYDPTAYKRVNIPSSKYFPDGMKSAGGTYDELQNDGAIKRVGSVDLGTLNWTCAGTGEYRYFVTSDISDIRRVDNGSEVPGLLNAIYPAFAQSNWYLNRPCMFKIAGNAPNFCIGDPNYTDAAAFKSAMSGVMLYYELATPVGTTIEPSLQPLLTYKGFTSFSAPNSLTQNGPLSVIYYTPGGDNPEEGFLTSYKRKLYMGRNIEWNQLLDKSGFYTTRTINGVTFTNNGDGTVTASGTATANADFRVSATSYKILANHKCLITGGVNENAMVRFSGSSAGVWEDKGNGVITNQTVDTTAYNFSIRVNSGTTVSNLVFKPQLFDLTQMFGAGNEPKTPAEFWSYFDNAFYPYDAGTVKPLFKVSRKSYWGVCQALGLNVYATATPDEYSWANVRSFGASAASWKQELDPSTFAATTTVDGVTITNMNNGYYRLNGAATAAGSFVICEYPEVLNGTYHSAFTGHRVFLMGCPEGGSTTTYSLQLLGWAAADTGNGVIKQTAVGADRRIAIVWAEGTVFSNTDFRPLLFDLTQMFGLMSDITNIADSRINWIKSYATTHSAYGDRIYIASPVTKLISAGRNLYSGNETFTSAKYTYQLTGTELATTLRNLPNGTYVLSWDYASDATAGLQNAIRFYRGSTYYTAVTNGSPFVVNDRFKTFTSAPAYFGIGLTSGTMTNFMLEIGSVKHAYEPYIAPTEYLIPAEVQALSGYGWAVNDIYNTVIREGTAGWACVHNVASVDMETLTWNSNPGTYPTNSFYSNTGNNLKPGSYNIIAFGADFAALYIDSQGHIIAATNEEYESGAAFAEALRGVIAVYEAQTPIRTDITDIMKSALRDFPTRGELIWENDAKMAIPNTIRYSQ